MKQELKDVILELLQENKEIRYEILQLIKDDIGVDVDLSSCGPGNIKVMVSLKFANEIIAYSSDSLSGLTETY